MSAGRRGAEPGKGGVQTGREGARPGKRKGRGVNEPSQDSPEKQNQEGSVCVWREGGREIERERFQGGWLTLLWRLARPKSAGRAAGLETQERPCSSQGQRPTAGRVPHGSGSCGCVLAVWSLSLLGSCAEIDG